MLAPADGTCRRAGPGGDYGNLVVLDHGFGIVTQVRPPVALRGVSRASAVKRGDVIGYVGSTGRSTGAHLHYEIWMNGRLTNPMRCSRSTDPALVVAASQACR